MAVVLLPLFLSLFFVHVTPSQTQELIPTKKLVLGPNISEHDGIPDDRVRYVLNCPIPSAIWIIPMDNKAKFRLKNIIEASKTESKVGVSQLILPPSTASSGTYSCCTRQQLPPFMHHEVVHMRSNMPCLDGCCPWFRRDCQEDLAERTCMQLRLQVKVPPMVFGSSVFLKDNPTIIPCFQFGQIVNITISNGLSLQSKHLIPGHGYCLAFGSMPSAGLLRCDYENQLVKRVLVGKYDKTLDIEKPIIVARQKESKFPTVPDEITVLRTATITLRCRPKTDKAAFLRWENETCYSYAKGDDEIVWTRRIMRSQRVVCQGSPTTENSTLKRTSVNIKVIDAPFVRITLARETIPIIQHQTQPQVTVQIDYSPQLWNLRLTAINNSTSVKFHGTCDGGFQKSVNCSVKLPRPAINTQYELLVTLSPISHEENVSAVSSKRSVRLIPQFNRKPNITGLPRIGATGRSYVATCVPFSNPTATIHWFLNGKTMFFKNVSTLNLTDTVSRESCLRCEVRHPLLPSVSRERCFIRSDVDLRGFDVRLDAVTQKPLFRLALNAFPNDKGEGTVEVVEAATLLIRCMTYIPPSSKSSLKITINGQPIKRDIKESWNGYSRTVSFRLSTKNSSMVNGSLIGCRSEPGRLTSPPLRLLLRHHEAPVIATLPARRRILDAREFRQSCEASGVPMPWVVWRFEGKEKLQGSGGEVVKSPNVSEPGRGASELFLSDVSSANSGVYICEARGAYVTVTARLQVDVNPTVFESKEMVIVLVVVFLVLLLCLLSIAYLFHKNWRLRRKLFERYRLLLCSPDLGDGSNNYADPFDISLWQLRPKDLRLTRERLGQGEFGRVLKGFLSKADAPEPVPVAVKQLLTDSRVLGVGRFAEEESQNRRKFMEEIQIMSNVGQHPNVLQMMGLVIDEETLQISLVCEFCAGGNLVHHLFERQASFVMRPGPNSDPDALCFEDLLTIAADIARGMAHIHSRGILHRDLAARNVLIGADGEAKISDFGLSRNRSEYSNLEYARRNTNERLPWKWLALECLRDGLFSAKSDVWSFGITLWEIFSLGNRPYPEQYYTTYFIRNLNSGYRLSRPAYASDSIFEVMKSCWLTEQDLRPSFPQITTTIQSLIDRWRAEGGLNGRSWNEKSKLSPMGNGNSEKPILAAQYVNVVGSPVSPASEQCEIKLLDAYVPMSEGSAYTTYSHVF